MFNLRLPAMGLLCCLALAGCPQPVGPEDSGGGTGGGSACTPGTVGCGCEAGACSSGECVNGACVSCQRGSAACVCRANNTCDMGLRCASGACETCPAGQDGCACGAGDMCSAGLSCSNGTCVPDTCVAGAPGCPCRTQGPVCNTNAYCDSTSRCQMCSTDIVGCACSSTSTCSGGLVCEMSSMQCRNGVSCSQLKMDGGTCVPNQLCTQTPNMDAVCVAGQCEPNFKFNTAKMRCDACTSTGCANEACAGPVGMACTAENRDCNEANSVGTCGACSTGFTESPQGTCVPSSRCGSVTCVLGQYCDISTGTPTCQMRPCPPGQAKAGAAGACAACTTPASCPSGAGSGYTGNYWPFQSAPNGVPDGRCVCETADGYFQPAGGTGLATLCDADNDGWVREDADNGAIVNNPALKANARCTIRSVDRIKLVEEGGLTAEVHSCASSMTLHLPFERLADGGAAPVAADAGPRIPGAGASACPTTIAPIRLLETERNDVDGVLNVSMTSPAYGPSGRKLVAKELNALTKGCVSTTGDFNNDGTSDLLEVQPTGAVPDDQERLKQFAYFFELYTGFFEPSSTGSQYGALVIQERSRCEPSFPLRYDPAATTLSDGGVTDGFSLALDGGSRYWRACERRRDVAFNASLTTGPLAAGFDFARFTCPAETGSCPLPQFPSATQVGPTDPRQTFFRDFGRCSLANTQPFDRRWRGFGHHSQFKCVNVTNTGLGGINVSPTAFDGGLGGLVFNTCVADACGADESTCRSRPGTGLQTSQPKVTCSTNAPPNAVGFAAVGYRPYGPATNPVTMNPTGYTAPNYERGCVTEDTESAIAGNFQSYVCPFPEFSMVKSKSDEAFGRHSCYLSKANFLWAPSDGGVQRATLRWSRSDAGVNSPNGVFR
ncbi:MAG: hypothetical protein Q8S33_00635 [Myxococcales bacterium]|nr:hypothetical protein [Myxococcales bacterium]